MQFLRVVAFLYLFVPAVLASVIFVNIHIEKADAYSFMDKLQRLRPDG